MFPPKLILFTYTPRNQSCPCKDDGRPKLLGSDYGREGDVSMEITRNTNGGLFHDEKSDRIVKARNQTRFVSAMNVDSGANVTLEAVEAHGDSTSTVLRRTMTSWSNTARIQTRYRCEVVVFAMRTMMQFPQQTKSCKSTSQLDLVRNRIA